MDRPIKFYIFYIFYVFYVFHVSTDLSGTTDEYAILVASHDGSTPPKVTVALSSAHMRIDISYGRTIVGMVIRWSP